MKTIIKAVVLGYVCVCVCLFVTTRSQRPQTRLCYSDMSQLIEWDVKCIGIKMDSPNIWYLCID